MYTSGQSISKGLRKGCIPRAASENAQRIRTPKDGRSSKQKQDDMFLIAGKCGTLIRRDKGAGSRLLANARKS